MKKEKDIHWHDNEVKKLRKTKREFCKPISSFEYGPYAKSNKEIKKLKDDIARKRRSVKRAEKQNLEKFIEEEVSKHEEGKSK